MVTTIESPVILSLCTGLLRGLEVGIEHAIQRPIAVAAYAEIEAFIVENLLQGMEKGVLVPAPVWTDVKTFPFKSFHGKIHGIIGGYPCQPFSVAGNQRGTEDPRHLWPFIKNGIEAARPVFCFFENVRGHLNLGFEQVHADLQGLGYEVRFGLYSAEEVGATHKRERLFILAIRVQKRKARRSGASLLAYAKGVRKQSRTNKHFKNADCRMADSYRKSFRSLSECKQRQRRYFKINRFNLNRCNTGMAYSDDRRSKQDWQSGKLRTKRSFQPSCHSRRANQGQSSEGRFYGFPERPGQPQYEWERKRVVEPGLGVTINGYNFREDLLRGAGNGVVWQTAAFAFEDLMKKF